MLFRRKVQSALLAMAGGAKFSGTAMPNPPKPSAIEQMAEEQTAAFLRRSSVTFLEAAISLMSHHMKLSDVIEVLRAEAAQLEEFG